jgi:hypothetical protein
MAWAACRDAARVATGIKRSRIENRRIIFPFFSTPRPLILAASEAAKKL